MLLVNSSDMKMSSIEIAELTGKEHYNVMRDIATMLKSLEIDAFNFEGTYLDSLGREQRNFLLPLSKVYL